MKQENLDKIIAFRHVLHKHPELSNHEVHTRKLMSIMSSIFFSQLKKMVVVRLSVNHYLKSIMWMKFLVCTTCLT